jgi:AcrR family transcriptional regulator
MAPRAYTLGRRAEGASSTRQRIIDVTIDLYRERGVPGTTLTAVAERADVSRGTILHHFRSADGLLGAVLDSVLDRLELPDERVLDGIESRDERIRTFAVAMAAFLERTAPWWAMFEGQMERPELKSREAAYWAALARLQAAAIGPELASDPVANATVLALIHPATQGTVMWSFERAGASREEAIEVIGDLAVEAVRRRAVVSSPNAPRGSARNNGSATRE